jgi:hypothetical protein
MNLKHFPLRGVLVFDELIALQYNSSKTNYHINTFYGKGLIKAHDLTENQQWAGMIIDNSVFQTIKDYDQINQKCIKYPIPFKSGKIEMYAMRIVTNLKSELGLQKTKQDIENNFKRYDKWNDNNESLNIKLINTFRFIEFLKEKPV